MQAGAFGIRSDRLFAFIMSESSGVTFAFRCYIHSILLGGPRLGLAMDTASPIVPRMAVVVVPPSVSPTLFSFWTPDEDIGDADDDFRIIRADPMGYYVQRQENGLVFALHSDIGEVWRVQYCGQHDAHTIEAVH
ncbi:hypothetical protein M404DRAFT_830170 [Pisolithus tinctorius Marx 270]|uniref:Uncharacterized protein n=1 Tax=Pisolithus tinctorius Marx 270 TaxID=870435 RepID=A0A0C3PR36_PISTI|nr:hypothetical protein M404DRAFT_830170 [Pisolithus tinctorius Marx 270]